MEAVTIDDIRAAASRIAGGVLVTPCTYAAALSQLTGCELYCKLEMLQRTGSFKERGARNALLLLDETSRHKGVIAASAGNHALALAHHGAELGIPVTVVMPSYAPLVKQVNSRKLGARVIVSGNSFAEARAKADELVEREGLTYVHGYDDPAVIAGQGTLGLELLEQVENLDAVVVPVGGGGLLAGVALAIKSVKPSVQVIAVEAAAAAGYSAALAHGRVVPMHCGPTLADGLAVSSVGRFAFQVARDRVDQVVQVSEPQIARAVVRLMELERSVVEGAGSAGLAAVCGPLQEQLAGKRVAIVLCGGNIDLLIVSRLIEVALASDGRLARFSAVISDRPGGLAQFATAVATIGASIQQVEHERIFAGPDMAAVTVRCTVETRDRNHMQDLYQHLRSFGIVVTPLDDLATI
ncbi:threonine dehydratase [Pirellula staleyi DSM 6068]|uniref:Threonine dehydratase n=1 Tax=Pirellula staleyi (strain ATCC 27377 / DSM 6068 / ICPB 4128) TaxID=530564 RepID=D2R9E9_PIRSD|nr:threonine ammonia-lyase [Pirellula staleyi]ADB17699.1 threonine dehydratase [Pirellula staleyi DSM 6068]